MSALPAGWTEHVGPGGTPYFYHAGSGQSTFVRPAPFPTFQSLAAASVSEPPKKKEKPLYKIPIPSTPWIRVKTTHGNVFFTHAERKESIWTVPDEIRDAVAAMDWVALEQQAALEKEAKERDKETQRVLADAQATTVDTSKRKAPEEAPAKPRKKKRRHEPVADQAIDEIVITDAPVGDDAPEDEEDDDASEVFSDPEAEAAWQREMAEDMAALAASEAAKPDEPAKEATPPPEEPSTPAAPQINLSTEEATALFKTLLSEKNPSPMAPFASVIPQLITDPRYILLPSQHDRENAFNEWCRETTRAARLAKAKLAAAVPAPATTTPEIVEEPLSKEEEKARVREAYDQLLRDEVTSTRTSWDEFRRKWKKDRRFFAFGRDDREKEKVFRSWLKSLGERKRAQAQKAEVEFMELLKSHAAKSSISPTSQWKDVKRPLVKDPRYDAVGSSSLREELFGTFLKARFGQDPIASEPTQPAPEQPASAPTLDRKARAERALREREDKIHAERDKVDRDVARSRAALGSAEAEQDLISFYVDSVRDPTASYAELEPTFAQHTRFSSSPLAAAQKQHLFVQHIARLAQKHISTLDTLFVQFSPSLATLSFDSLPPSSQSSLEKSLPANKLGYTIANGGLARAFSAWHARRSESARIDFQKLLEENSFVEFWGKVGKIEGAGVDEALAVPGEEDEENAVGEEDGVGKVDLKTLAKGIGEIEIERVLKNDQRYRAFDHMPEERIRWVRDYLSSLSAPSLSVHVDHS